MSVQVSACVYPHDFRDLTLNLLWKQKGNPHRFDENRTDLKQDYKSYDVNERRVRFVRPSENKAECTGRE